MNDCIRCFPELSVVVPVCDEAENVAALCAEIAQALGDVEHEVVFVDDGSRDGTPERLEAMRPRIPHLRVLRHASNAGQSAALRTGVHAARAPWIATLDGDGQNDPADVARMWQLAGKGAAATGLYIGQRTRRRDSAVRILSSRIANGVRSRLLRDNVPDTGCGVKLFRREVFLALPYFDHMHRFLPALVAREGLAVVSTPVAHRPRRAGKSKYGIGNRLWVGIVDLLGVLWLQRRRPRARLLAD
jgi:dolichol-phosphate mannosyltransferase